MISIATTQASCVPSLESKVSRWQRSVSTTYSKSSAWWNRGRIISVSSWGTQGSQRRINHPSSEFWRKRIEIGVTWQSSSRKPRAEEWRWWFSPLTYATATATSPCWTSSHLKPILSARQSLRTRLRIVTRTWACIRIQTCQVVTMSNSTHGRGSSITTCWQQRQTIRIVKHLSFKHPYRSLKSCTIVPRTKARCISENKLVECRQESSSRSSASRLRLASPNRSIQEVRWHPSKSAKSPVLAYQSVKRATISTSRSSSAKSSRDKT